MDRITRKTLKTDRFATEVTESVEYLAQHRRQAMIYGGIIVAVLVLSAGIYFYWQHRRTAAHDALARALETYRAPVTEEPQQGLLTFRTQSDKDAKALKDFQAIDRDFPRFKEGQIARYYIGLIYYDMGKMADAQKQLEKVAGEGQDSIPALARLTLADVYAAQGKDEEARKTLDFLIQHPTDTVSQDRAQLAMAGYLRVRKPEEARKLLLEIEKHPGPAAAVAGTMLRDLGQS
jgi:predicted negative regulator of RcsB-dependent stress response